MKREELAPHVNSVTESLRPITARVTTGSGISFARPSALDGYFFVTKPFNAIFPKGISLIEPSLAEPCSAGSVIPAAGEGDMSPQKEIRIFGMGPIESMYVTLATPHPPVAETVPNTNRQGPSRPGKQRQFDFLIDSANAQVIGARHDGGLVPLTPSLRAGERGSILMSQIEHTGQGNLFEDVRPLAHAWDLPDVVRAFWNEERHGAKPYYKVPVTFKDPRTGLVRLFIPAHSRLSSIEKYPLGTNFRLYPDLEVLSRGIVTAGHTCVLVTSKKNGLLLPTNGAESTTVYIHNVNGKMDFADPKCRAHLPPGATIGGYPKSLWAEFDAAQPGDSKVIYRLFDRRHRTINASVTAATEVMRQFHLISQERQKHGQRTVTRKQK